MWYYGLMTRFKMRIFGAIPNGRKGQEFFYSLIFLLCALTLSGCVTSKKTAPLAPIPPVASHDFLEYSDFPLYAAHYFSAPQAYDSLGESEETQVNQSLAVEGQGEGGHKLAVRKRCSIKDRFDRDALVAFEWNRSRMSFDVDGVGGGSGDSGMRLEYKIRLQPEKSEKQKCRYNAKWQGLLGSGYNELMLRKEDTVWSKIREKRQETMHYLEQLF